MKLVLCIWTLLVVGLYSLCLHFHIDVFVVLWALLAIFGLIFLVADHATANTLSTKKSSMMGTSEEDIAAQIEQRRKAILEDKSPISTAIAYAAIPLLLCLIHNYIFL